MAIMLLLHLGVRKCDLIYNFLELSQHPAVASFTGAFFAFIFMLLLAEDTERRKKRNLPKELDIIESQAIDLKKTVANNKSKLEETGIPVDAIYMKLSTDILRNYRKELLHLFKTEEIHSLDAICFRITGINKIIVELEDTVQKIYDLKDKSKLYINASSDLEADNYIKDLPSKCDDIIKELGILVEMIGKHRNKKYSVVVTTN